MHRIDELRAISAKCNNDVASFAPFCFSHMGTFPDAIGYGTKQRAHPSLNAE